MASEVQHNAAMSRYELFVDGQLIGVADYHLSGDSIVFPHTEIDPPMRGNGYGAVLVQGALDDVRGTGRRVVPRCWYVAQFINEHPDYRDLLAA